MVILIPIAECVTTLEESCKKFDQMLSNDRKITIIKDNAPA